MFSTIIHIIVHINPAVKSPILSDTPQHAHGKRGEVYFTFNESEPQENTYTSLPLIMNDGESEPRPTLAPIPELINPPDPIPGKITHCNIYGDVKVCASASNSILSQFSNVTVYGRLVVNGFGQAGEKMHTTWLLAY